jgi:hypothetical protein
MCLREVVMPRYEAVRGLIVLMHPTVLGRVGANQTAKKASLARWPSRAMATLGICRSSQHGPRLDSRDSFDLKLK